MPEMAKRERVQAAVRGEAVDRVPVSFWGHDFLREWSAEDLRDAMVESVRTYDYDYLKVNPRATYYAEAWGCTFTRPKEALGQPAPVAFAVQDAAGLSSIRPVDATGGPFAE